jgi:LacI family transcriptional regulator
MYKPPLTTIKPMGYEIGKTATKLLFKRINSVTSINTEPTKVRLDTELIIRKSTIK